MTTVGSVNGLIQPQQARTAAVKKGAVKPAVSAATPSVTKGTGDSLCCFYGNSMYLNGHMLERRYNASFNAITSNNAYVLKYANVDTIKMTKAKKREFMQQIWKNFGFKDDLPKRVKNFGELKSLIDKKLGRYVVNCGANNDLMNAKYLVEFNKCGLISDNAFIEAFNKVNKGSNAGAHFGEKALKGAALKARKNKCIRIAEEMAKAFDAQNYTSSEFLKNVHAEQVESARILRKYGKPAAKDAGKPAVSAATNAAEDAGKSVVTVVMTNGAEGAVKPAVSAAAEAAGDAAGSVAKTAEKAAKGLGKWGWGAIIVAGLATGGFIATKIFGKKEPEAQSGLNQQA